MNWRDIAIILGIILLIIIWGRMIFKPGPETTTTTTTLSTTSIPTTTSISTLPIPTTTSISTLPIPTTTSISTLPIPTTTSISTTIQPNITTIPIGPPYIDYLPDECESIRNSPDRDSCYHNIAVRDQNLSLCQGIVNEQRRMICISAVIMKIAVRNKNASICDDIPLETIKKKCEELVKG